MKAYYNLNYHLLNCFKMPQSEHPGACPHCGDEGRLLEDIYSEDEENYSQDHYAFFGEVYCAECSEPCNLLYVTEDDPDEGNVWHFFLITETEEEMPEKIGALPPGQVDFDTHEAYIASLERK